MNGSVHLLSDWVLYRQLELTKLTRSDLHHDVGTKRHTSEFVISMRAEGSKSISPWFLRFINDSITWDMLLENDGDFGEEINGTDIHPDSNPSMTYLCKCPLGLGFVQATGAHVSRLASCCGFVHTKRCPSVCSSVCLTFSYLFHYVPTILKFQLMPLTEVMSMPKDKVRGQRSKVTEVKTNFDLN